MGPRAVRIQRLGEQIDIETRSLTVLAESMAWAPDGSWLATGAQEAFTIFLRGDLLRPKQACLAIRRALTQ